jgi:hypothetical protein
MCRHDWQVYRTFKRKSMCRHDWRIYRIDSQQFAVRVKFERCTCWTACFIDVRLLTNITLSLFEFECPIPLMNYAPARHQGGGRSTKKFLPAQINPFITDKYTPLAAVDRLMYHSHGSCANILAEVAHDPSKVLAVMPLRLLASKLTKIQLKEIIAVHKIAVPNRGLID